LSDQFLSTGQSACSILVPIYNGAAYIQRGLQSIISSARDIDEILIINDGSSDMSESEFTKVAEIDNRIRIFNRAHFGLVSTLNFGISECRNDLIARADIDDTYYANRIQTQLDFMVQNPSCAAVFSDYEIVGSNGKDLGVIPSPVSPIATKLSLLLPRRTAHPSVMFRKSMVGHVGGYHEVDYPAEDLGLWIRLSKEYDLASIPEVLVRYTVHQSSITSQNRDLMRIKTNLLVTEILRDFELKMIEEEAVHLWDRYAMSPYSTERKLLHLMDLYTLYKRIHTESFLKFILYIFSTYRLWDLRYSFIVINLLKNRLARNHYRKYGK
jgi:glycosyltransferase involved in cell wall biosynthesis